MKAEIRLREIIVVFGIQAMYGIILVYQRFHGRSRRFCPAPLLPLCVPPAPQNFAMQAKLETELRKVYMSTKGLLNTSIDPEHNGKFEISQAALDFARLRGTLTQGRYAFFSQKNLINKGRKRKPNFKVDRITKCSL
jgi:hypothetical protein